MTHLEPSQQALEHPDGFGCDLSAFPAVFVALPKALGPRPEGPGGKMNALCRLQMGTEGVLAEAAGSVLVNERGTLLGGVWLGHPFKIVILPVACRNQPHRVVSENHLDAAPPTS